MNDSSKKTLIATSSRMATSLDVASQPSVVGSLPKQSILERVMLPGQPVTYRVRRDIVVAAARGLKLEHG